MQNTKETPLGSASKKGFPVRKLVESALMLAIGTGLSVIKILDLPAGGSVTIAAMLPVILISYRNGLKWGLLTGLAFGIIQQLLGLKSLSYVTGWQSVLAIIFLDYVIAYAVTGFGGVFRKIKGMSQANALCLGGLLAASLRFLCHFITGFTVWSGLSIPDEAAVAFSASYNATYMIPEAIILMVVAYYVGSAVDFRSERLKPYVRKSGESFSLMRILAGLSITAGVIIDAVLVFSKLQDPDSGAFDITRLSYVNWLVFGIVLGISALLSLIFIALHFTLKNTKQSAG